MRFRIVILAAPVRRAGGVEIAQEHRLESVQPLVPAQHALKLQLRLAVGILRPLGQVLRHRHPLRNPVGGAGGGEDDPADPGLPHRLGQIPAADHIVLEIQLRLLHRFAHEREGGEMHHRIRLDATHRRLDGPRRPQVAVDERGARIHRRAVAARQVVEHAHAMPRVEQALGRDAADVARAAGHEYFHGVESPRDGV
jgi:hypothetical protein